MRKLLTTGALAVAALGLTATTVAAGPPAGRPGSPPTEDIVGIASGNDNFDILAPAPVKTAILEEMPEAGPLTVFAQNDAPFQSLLGGASEGDIIAAINGYDEEATAGFQSILLYHVTPGRRDVKSVQPVPQLPTLNGTALTKERGTRTIDTNAVEDGVATIVGTAPASNGIVHIIDTVLVP